MVKVRLEDICDIVTFVGNNDFYTLTIHDKEELEPQVVTISKKDNIWILSINKGKSLAMTEKEQKVGDLSLPSSILRDWDRCETTSERGEKFFLEYLKGVYDKII